MFLNMLDFFLFHTKLTFSSTCEIKIIIAGYTWMFFIVFMYILESIGMVHYFFTMYKVIKLYDKNVRKKRKNT